MTVETFLSRRAYYERMLRELENHIRELEIKRAKFGDLHVPTHVETELKELQERYTETKRQHDNLIASRDGADSPYRGLLSFEEQHAHNFFGRERLIEDLVERLKTLPFLTVMGGSGTGKSSVVRAGLIPRLKANALPDSQNWKYGILKPGQQPINELAATLARFAPETNRVIMETQLSTMLASGNDALVRAARLSLGDAQSERLVLVIDQAEELWTLAPPDQSDRPNQPSQQAVLIDLLETAGTTTDSRLLLILVLRHDFLDRVAEHPRLKDLVNANTVLVGPLTEDELRDAIVKPTDAVGNEFEPGLVDDLIRDTVGRAGALPLLQFTLDELWKLRSNGLLTRKAYQDLGGVEGGLASRADAIFEQKYKTEEEREAVRKALLRLVQPIEGTGYTRRRVRLQELKPAGGNVNEVQRLLQPLVAERLITVASDPTSGSETIEVSHEALISAWKQLQGWIEENDADLRREKILYAAAEEWQQRGQDSDLLWRGARLVEAEELVGSSGMLVSDQVRAFIEASVAAREAQRQRELEQAAETARKKEQIKAAEEKAELESKRKEEQIRAAQEIAESERKRAEEQETAATKLRKRGFALAVAFVLAAILAVTTFVGFLGANNQRQTADAQRQRAEVAQQEADQSRQTAVANEQIANTQRQEAVQAKETASRAQQKADQARQTAVVNEQVAAAIAAHSRGSSDKALALAKTAVTTNAMIPPDMLSIYYQAASNYARRLLVGHDDVVRSVAFINDSQAVSVDDAGQLILWDVTTGQILLQRRVSEHALFGVTVKPFERDTVLVGADDGTLKKVSLNREQDDDAAIETFEGHTGGVISIAFSPDGKRALSGGFDGTLILWNTESNPWQIVQQLPDPVVPAGAPDKNAITSVAFNPANQAELLVGSYDGLMRIWNSNDLTAQPGLFLCYLGNEPNPVTEKRALAVAFSPDGNLVACGNFYGDVYLWSRGENGEWQSEWDRSPYGSSVTSLVFSADGKTLLSAGLDGTVRLLNVETGRNIQVYRGHSGGVLSVAYSPDGSKVLSASDDGTLRLWDFFSFSPNGTRPTQLSCTSAITQVTSIALRPGQLSSGPTVLFADAFNSAVSLCEVASGRLLRSFVPPTDDITSTIGVNSVAFSGDGKFLLAAYDSGDLLRWSVDDTLDNVDDGKPEFIANDETRFGSISSVAYDPKNNNRAATASNVFFRSDDKIRIDGYVRIWSLDNPPQVQQAFPINGGVRSVAFSPDGRYIASANNARTVQLWDLQLQKSKTLKGHTQAVSAIAFSADGNYILSGGEDETMRLWSVETGQLLRTFSGHYASVQSVAFGPKATLALSGDVFGRIRLWNIETGQPLQTLSASEGSVRSLAFNPDGKFILASNDDTSEEGNNGGIWRWEIFTSEDLLDYVPKNRYSCAEDPCPTPTTPATEISALQAATAATPTSTAAPPTATTVPAAATPTPPAP